MSLGAIQNKSSAAEAVSYDNSTTSATITSTNVQGAIDQLFTSVSNGKSLIASAITDKGISTSASDSWATMAGNIEGLKTIELKTERSIGKDFDITDSDGELRTGYLTTKKYFIFSIVINSIKVFGGLSSDEIYNSPNHAYTITVPGSSDDIIVRLQVTSYPTNYFIIIDNSRGGSWGLMGSVLSFDSTVFN